MQEEKIIHIADVVFGAQPVLCELVQVVQVDVREELAAQIAYRQPQVGSLRGQALVLGHFVEDAPWAANLKVGTRIVPENLERQVPPPGIDNKAFQLAGKNPLVDGDEEVRQIAFQVVSLAAPVLRHAPNLAFQPLGGVQGSSSWDASAAVGNELRFDAGSGVVVEKVVDDAIPKVRRPHFSVLRPGDDEAD